MKKILMMLSALSAVISSVSGQHPHSGHQHNFGAPISIMGDHVHLEGEWMVSYRYMTMLMDGMGTGSNSLSSQSVYDKGYMVTPTEMKMDMHMLSLMYAPTENLTIMGMVGYILKEMEHETKARSMMRMKLGETFTRESEGLGDVSVLVLYKVWQSGSQSLHFNAGVSLPTGGIDEEHAGFLPYPMQLGSGTFDLIPGFTYNGSEGKLSWGGQLLGTVHLSDNDADYALGDALNVNGWGAYQFIDSIAGSIRLSYLRKDEIDGNDARITTIMNPAQDSRNNGGEWLDLGVGLSITPKVFFHGSRIAVEYAFPLTQDLNGVQMKSDHAMTVGWQLAW